MTYVAGFLTPVPNGNKQAYIESARKAWPLFKEYGALQIMETWGDQVPAGEHTISGGPSRWKTARRSVSRG